jgi:hypothetical protein
MRLFKIYMSGRGAEASQGAVLILEGWVGWDSRPAIRRCALRSLSLPDSRLKIE